MIGGHSTGRKIALALLATALIAGASQAFCARKAGEIVIERRTLAPPKGEHIGRDIGHDIGMVHVPENAADAKLKPGDPIPRMELERFIDGAVMDAMTVDHIAGVAVAVVQPGGATVLRGYGDAGDGRAVDPHTTLFRIASISKTFTWILLMREVERGRIRLDAPVNDYLPPRLRIPAQGMRQPIRIIHLMSHSSGFEERSFGRNFVHDGMRLLSLEEMLVRFRPDRVREPGEIASYSNYGAALAGYIVSRSAGVPFEALAEREIFTPLAMHSTTFREPYAARSDLPAPMPAQLVERLSAGYVWDGADFSRIGFQYVSEDAPAGSASSTAADMASYMLAQLRGGAPIYGPPTARALREPILDVPSGVNGWAHGFMVRPLAGRYLSYGHGGSLDAFLSNFALIPQLNLGVFVATNTSTGKPLAERLPGLIVQRFYAPDRVRRRLRGDPGLITQAARYAGTYYSTRRAYSGLEAFEALLNDSNRVAVTTDGYLVTRVANQAQTWVPDGAPGRFRSADGDGARLQFALDAEGRAIRFPGARGTFSLERADLLLDPTLFKAAALLTLIAALARLVATAVRIAADIHRTAWQRRLDILALLTSCTWFAAFAFFALWTRADAQTAMNESSVDTLTPASVAASAAAAGSVLLLMLTPLARRGGICGTGAWGRWRTARHLFTVLIFLMFATLIGLRGGLSPWP